MSTSSDNEQDISIRQQLLKESICKEQTENKGSEAYSSCTAITEDIFSSSMAAVKDTIPELSDLSKVISKKRKDKKKVCPTTLESENQNQEKATTSRTEVNKNPEIKTKQSKREYPKLKRISPVGRLIKNSSVVCAEDSICERNVSKYSGVPSRSLDSDPVPSTSKEVSGLPVDPQKNPVCCSNTQFVSRLREVNSDSSDFINFVASDDISQTLYSSMDSTEYANWTNDDEEIADDLGEDELYYTCSQNFFNRSFLDKKFLDRSSHGSMIAVLDFDMYGCNDQSDSDSQTAGPSKD